MTEPAEVQETGFDPFERLGRSIEVVDEPSRIAAAVDLGEPRQGPDDSGLPLGGRHSSISG
jgi:hypothetical protein